MARLINWERLSYCNGYPNIYCWINHRFRFQYDCFVGVLVHCYDTKRKLQDRGHLQRHHDCFYWPSLRDVNGWGYDHTFLWWGSRFFGNACCHFSRILADDPTVLNIVSVGLVAVHRDLDGQITRLLHTLSIDRRHLLLRYAHSNPILRFSWPSFRCTIMKAWFYPWAPLPACIVHTSMKPVTRFQKDVPPAINLKKMARLINWERFLITVGHMRCKQWVHSTTEYRVL